MNEIIDRVIDDLGLLQFETGGELLDSVVQLRADLQQERARRIAELRADGMTDAQIGVGQIER